MESKPNESNERTRTTEQKAGAAGRDSVSSVSFNDAPHHAHEERERESPETRARASEQPLVALLLVCAVSLARARYESPAGWHTPFCASEQAIAKGKRSRSHAHTRVSDFFCSPGIQWKEAGV